MVHQAEPEKSSTAASLVDLEDGHRYPLRNLQWLGRDPLLDQVGLNDLFTGNREARIYQENDGSWFIKRGESLNGLWVRVPSVAIHERGSQFQCGEQRFEFRIG